MITTTKAERDLEEALVSKLKDLKYEYRADIRDRATLERNFRGKFESLNRVTLTDGEFQRLMDEIVTPDVFTADLETGVIDPTTAPEFRALPLFEDRWVGVARDGHPVLEARMTLKRYGVSEHVQILRRGMHSSEVDDAARAAGAERRIGVIVNGFAAAVALSRDTDLIATVPERHTEGLRRGVSTFALPFEIASFTISMLWHPRMDGDLAHRWLRSCVRRACSMQATR